MANMVLLARIAYKNRNLLIALLTALVLMGLFFLLVAIAILGFIFGVTGNVSLTGGYQVGEPTARAIQDIPPEYIDIFKSVGKSYDIPWTVLAACAKHDNQFGQGTADGFLSFSDDIFDVYGQDGNMDGDIDKHNPRDAINTLANYLNQKGAADNFKAALYEVYGSQTVGRILKTVEEYTDTIMPVISGKWPLPRQFTYVSSPFGFRLHPIFNTRKMHTGIDIPADLGTPVYPACDGTVITAGWGGGYGNVVVISHDSNTQTWYAHLHQIDVVKGQQVTRDTAIGMVGSTGNSTGPHLHFEVRLNNRPVDPEPWLNTLREESVYG